MTSPRNVSLAVFEAFGLLEVGWIESHADFQLFGESVELAFQLDGCQVASENVAVFVFSRADKGTKTNIFFIKFECSKHLSLFCVAGD